eukprot:9494294-Pyramimonas_sp.AAC.2
MFENECSMWINMTRSQSGRRARDILGNESVRKVLESNMCAMVMRGAQGTQGSRIHGRPPQDCPPPPHPARPAPP